jgi:hypothetical protein
LLHDGQQRSGVIVPAGAAAGLDGDVPDHELAGPWVLSLNPPSVLPWASTVAVTPELGVACAAAGSTPRLTAHTATPAILRSFRMVAGSPTASTDASAVPAHVGRADYPCRDVCQHRVP